MTLMLVEKMQPFHHPRVEAAARMPSDFTDDVHAIPQPSELRARRRREDCDLAIFALVAVARYGFATVLEASVRVV